ncbi:4-hydroxy-3-methylbut-2-enyl diphosphate reductase [[Mycoplasma] testudinis]|uniref:4-hydroxy-3-methylbut-2-enyl diphosphate reductase n=1 Tax=[Mycoplasma] testudinis TaxID=33924 RepID=UPI0004806694|nr:4-hydroxy-3-methylbut-2-enyl diphosphate reductase [[Mycoplasma] testudinis]
MELIKINPQGFCSGVINAFAITKNVVANNPNKKIYMIGWLVHNEYVVKEMTQLGIIVLDDRKEDRKKLVSKIDPSGEPIVIFSAHGTDPKIIEYATKRGLRAIDATCVYVTNTHDIINEKLATGHQVLYIGVRNHPETAAALSLNPKIKLLETPEDVAKLDIKDEKIFMTNQTTISIYEFYGIIKSLRKRFKNIECKNDICNATNERQEALMYHLDKNISEGLDLVIVVGDKRSNNSQKLVSIAKEKNVESYLLSHVADINPEWFKNKQRVGITAGASTPDYLTDEIIKEICKKFKATLKISKEL